jgi:hypothetical protein
MAAFARVRTDCAHDHVLLRNPHVVEEDLPLVERALSELVERLALRDAGKVEGNDGHATALESATRIDRAEEGGDGGDRPVRYPRGLLTADHVLVPFLGRDAVRAQRPVREVRLVEGERIAAVVGLGDRPAADVLAVGRAVALDQILAAGHAGEDPVHARDAETDREPGIAPAELFVDETAQARRLDRAQLRLRRIEDVEAELAVLLEDRPERRAGRDHVGGIGELVELRARRAHQLLGELVCRVADLPRFIREVYFDVRERHGGTSVGLGLPRAA